MTGYEAIERTIVKMADKAFDEGNAVTANAYKDCLVVVKRYHRAVDKKRSNQNVKRKQNKHNG